MLKYIACCNTFFIIKLIKGEKNILKDNLKILRKNKGLSQEELSIKLNVVRQTISKWESGLSVLDAEMLISISEVFETPVNEIFGWKYWKKRKINFLIIIDIIIILLFILLTTLGSPYQSWDYNDPQWSVIGTIWHLFEWIFFKIAPIIVIVITLILGTILIKRNK